MVVGKRGGSPVPVNVMVSMRVLVTVLMEEIGGLGRGGNTQGGGEGRVSGLHLS